jgi:hypothetical protein
MNHPGLPSRTALALVLAVGCATSCRSESRPADWELHSYEVSEGTEPAIKQILSELLKDRGRVQIGDSGRVIVFASDSIHRQLKQEFFNQPNRGSQPTRSAARPQSFSTTYWMVLVRPKRDGSPARPAIPELASVVPEIEKVSGPAELVLLDRIRLMSTDGGWYTNGRVFEVKQSASLAGGKVVSEVGISGRLEQGGSWDVLSTRVSLDPGQLALVGEIGLPGVPRGFPKDVRPPEAGDTLYVIMKASLDALAAK